MNFKQEKKRYIPPVCEPVGLAASDVIATSGEIVKEDIFDDEYTGN